MLSIKHYLTTGVARDQTMASLVSPLGAHQWCGSNVMGKKVPRLYPKWTDSMRDWLVLGHGMAQEWIFVNIWTLNGLVDR